MEIRIIRPGMLTTVQDLGRHGYRHTGLPMGGAMDAFAHRLANLLVGNDDNEAGLEMTMIGAELEFSSDALVAVTGANMGAISSGRPHLVKAGERLKFGAAKNGCRTYLAIAGGLTTPTVLGGKGTELRAGLGGHKGRALRSRDTLTANDVSREVVGRWSVDRGILPAYRSAPRVRIIGGAEAAEFLGDIKKPEYVVSKNSDRMGLRLIGDKLSRESTKELISSVVGPGTVQVPPDGLPIVLMADAQTIGGYPCIAHVVHADLPLLAQLCPGDKISFETVTLAEAHQLWRDQEKNLSLLREGLRSKLK